MKQGQRFGRLVLLEETAGGPLGREYRAALLGPGGFERIVNAQRLRSDLPRDAVARMIDRLRLVSRHGGPALHRVLGLETVGEESCLVYEHFEARSLAAVLERSRSEAFPLAVDHALMVASRAAVALEHLHGRRDGAGRPIFHGLLGPAQLLLSYEGEVRLTGLGGWAALGSTGLLGPAERRYLAPEQGGGEGGPGADVYALGALLLETLTGSPLAAGDLQGQLRSARLQTPVGGDEPLPTPLVEILRRALAAEPGDRYAEIHEMRRAIDTVLFSGDFTPTTFNLAFLMHTIFREDMEQAARWREEERIGEYGELPAAAMPSLDEVELPEVPAVRRGPATPPPAMSGGAVRSRDPDRSSASTPSTRALGSRSSPRLTRAGSGSHRTVRRGVAPRAPAVVAGLLAAVGFGAAAGYVFHVRAWPLAATTATTLSAPAAAALARVRELEARVAELEREKAEAETRAAEQAQSEIERRAAAVGQPVDPEALRRARDEARQRVRAEELQHQRQERQRLEDERRTEAERLAGKTPLGDSAGLPGSSGEPPPVSAAGPMPGDDLLARPASAAPPAPGAGAPPPDTRVEPLTPSPTPSPPRPTPPPVVRGALVAPDDPELVKPVPVREPRLDYPALALARRIEGTVVLRALVDETGAVRDVRVVQPSGVRFGLDEAAVANTRRRRYRPASKDGVPVKTWVTIEVRFALP